MSFPDEIAYLTATELAGAIRRKEMSPVELMNAVISRIEARNPSLNAFVFTAFDEARQQAMAAERAVTAGEDLGPLHGVPTAMKDLFDFKPGWPATFGGIPSLKDYSVSAYCTYAERMEAAGAILVGKTNSPIMGYRGTCDNPLFGPTRNPFDPTKNSGGSSGGSAAAVADGLLPLAEGTDGGGSIRIPAAWCNLYGFKASYGRVPHHVGFGAVAPFLHEGALTRTVDDAALALDVLAGYDDRDPFALDEKVSFAGATQQSIRGRRIAFSPDFGGFAVDRRVATVVAEAVRAFEQAGAIVEPVSFDFGYDQKELSDFWCRMFGPINVDGLEGLNGVAPLRDHADEFPPEFLQSVEQGRRLTALDMVRDQHMRTQVYEEIQRVMRSYDLLVTPTLGCLPVDNASDGNTVGPTSIEGVEVDPLIGWCLTYLINFTGHPAASIPAGFADGLPVGLQLIGRRYADADVLAASAAYEQVRPWHGQYRLAADRDLG